MRIASTIWFAAVLALLLGLFAARGCEERRRVCQRECAPKRLADYTEDACFCEAGP